MENPEYRKQIAMENFLKGYNCTQSVMTAFEDLLPVNDKETLIKMSSSFGGGMGRLRQVCGSVSGIFMVAGALFGYEGPETGQIKAEHYARIQELAKRFEAKFGSIVCKELLGLNVDRESPVPEARTKEYYEKRPCKEIIGEAAYTLAEFINEQNENISEQ